MNEHDIKTMLNIMLTSTEGQLKTAESEVMKTYLEGYQAAVKLILEYLEKK